MDSRTEPGVAQEALRQLKSGLEATKLELEDCKLKVNCLDKLKFLLCVQNCSSIVVFWYKFDNFFEQIRIIGEKQRLNELRNVHSPMKGIGNFSAQCLVPR